MHNRSSKSANSDSIIVEQTIKEILGGSFDFQPGLFVAEECIYSSETWTWVDKDDIRLNNYSPDRLTLDWPSLQADYNLTPEIVADLKKFAYMRLFFSREVFCGNRRNGNAHPATVVNEVRVAARFLSHVRSQLSGDNFSVVNHLSDIVAEDLSNAITTYENKQSILLKKVLEYVASPVLGQLFDCGPLGWNKVDISNLEWDSQRGEPYERLPDELFRFLSNAATGDVKQFLVAIGIETQDKTKVGEDSNIYLEPLTKMPERVYLLHGKAVG